MLALEISCLTTVYVYGSSFFARCILTDGNIISTTTKHPLFLAVVIMEYIFCTFICEDDSTVWNTNFANRFQFRNIGASNVKFAFGTDPRFVSINIGCVAIGARSFTTTS